ncbi:MAG: IS21 family transposase [Acutalibacteraceae bacterium]
MGRREFEVRDIFEIYRHWQAGESIRQIAKSLGVDRNTIRKYIRPAVDAGFGPEEPSTAAQLVQFIQETFPEVSDPVNKHRIFLEISRFHEEIKKGLATNTVTTTWQRLHDEDGLNASLSSFRRYIRAMLPETCAAHEVTVWRPEVPPGEEIQVDFGRLGRWNDPTTGQARTIWAFIMVLAYSRHMFVRPVFRMDARTWTECHVLAFEFFKGATKRIALDNLKSGVLKADIYDPAFNRSYAEMASHYGVLIDPCRSNHPKDKPRVERQVPYVRDSYWRGREFGSLKQMENEALRWCLSVAGQRIHGTTRQRPLEHYEREERPTLLLLPPTQWESVAWQTAKIGRDSHATVP